jgi:RNA-binding protein NOB1
MATTEIQPSEGSRRPAVTTKVVHSLCIDAGPVIKNDPPIGSLLQRAEEIYMIPEVLAEIRDVTTRRFVDTHLVPFLKQRSPRPDSLKFVSGFARKTGDLEALSRTDLHLLALTYELDCERSGGDARLRTEPTLKQVSQGKPPRKINGKETVVAWDASGTKDSASAQESLQEVPSALSVSAESTEAVSQQPGEVTEQVEALGLEDQPAQPSSVVLEHNDEATDSADERSEELDGDGWITPSNIQKYRKLDGAAGAAQKVAAKPMEVALLTSDYAMQNVALQIGLHIVAPSMSHITRVATWVLRCHGCFKITRDMTKQFCPNCGQPTLLRTSCSTDQAGNFRVHLKRNFQYNKRGNVYSVPKPVHGSASGRLPKNAAGRGNWGNDLILAEDQKEYMRATEQRRRAKQRDLMDEDYMPSLLSGERPGSGGKIKVGAGREVNSRRRRC